MQAHVTDQSQSFRLRERFREANVQHGQQVRADLPHIRVAVSPASSKWLERVTGSATVPPGDGEVYFCTMGRIRVREVLEIGDDLPLPSEVIVDGLDVPRSGTYDLLNALVNSNGNIRLSVDEQTRVVPVEGMLATILH
jgi:hypothetical protein